MVIKQKLNKKTRVIALLLFVIIVVFAILELTGKTSFFLDRAAKSPDSTAKTTSDAPSAQSDFSSGGDREPVQTPAESNTETSVTDTGGARQAQSTASPLVSKDGAITVYSPSNNALFISGSTLAGKTSAATISYRLADDVSGVTATGSLKVVNGNFSGTFNFSTKATQGRLDVFQTGAGGVEKSIIEIPVRFR